jgi:uncharacterized protein YoxC
MPELLPEIFQVVLIGVGIIALLVLAIALIELIRTLRRVRKTVNDLEPTIIQVNNSLETLEPALKRVDPLMERVSLTVDAVNLEIMRADQILADLSDVTNVASGAVKKVTNITEAPLNILSSATDKVRKIFSDNKSDKRVRASLKQTGSGSTQQAHSVSNADTAQMPVVEEPSQTAKSDQVDQAGQDLQNPNFSQDVNDVDGIWETDQLY